MRSRISPKSEEMESIEKSVQKQTKQTDKTHF